MLNTPLQLVIDGVPTHAGDVSEPLIRAVIVSLFTWRRALPGDELPGDQRMGWWGDTYPATPSDRIGSRLWLLGRSKILARTPAAVESYAREALQWLLDDKVAAVVTVQAERRGVEGIALGVLIARGDGSALDIRFVNAWDYLRNV